MPAIWDWIREDPGVIARAARRAGTSALGTYGAYVAHGLLHPRLLWPGASAELARAPMPGDDVVARPHWQATFATRIRAPAEAVWPWLVQLGYGRAGWYTWYPLDNGGRPSAERIEPALQTLGVGDLIPDGPRAAEGYGVWRVVALERPRLMVLHSRRNPVDGHELAEDAPGEPFLDTTWVFALSPLPEGTELVVRVRARVGGVRHPALLSAAARLLFGLGDNVMERSLLDGVRRRAEAAG